MNFDFNRLYLTTDGRIPRQEFWVGAIGLMVVGIVVSLLLSALFGAIAFITLLLSFILQLILAYPAYAVMAKRFQDRNKSGVFALVLIGLNIFLALLSLLGITGNPLAPNFLDWVLGLVILVIGVWFLVELGFLRGTIGPNGYGDDPLETAPAL